MGANGVRFCGSDVSSVRSSPEVGMTGVRKHRQIIQKPIWFKQRDGYFERLAPAASNHACNNHQSSSKDLSLLGFVLFFFLCPPSVSPSHLWIISFSWEPALACESLCGTPAIHQPIKPAALDAGPSPQPSLNCSCSAPGLKLAFSAGVLKFPLLPGKV